MIRFIVVVLSLLATAANAADIVTSAQRVDWTPGTHVGVIGGIPTNYTLAATLSPSGTTDRTAAINSAIAAASTGQYVLLSAGTYRTLGTIVFKSGVVLRGEGYLGNETVIDFRGNAEIFHMGTDFDVDPEGTAITANAAKGDTSVTMASTAAFAVGDYIVITMDNSTSATAPAVIEFQITAGSDVRVRRQLMKVTAKDATHLTFFPPLYQAMTTARNAEVHLNTEPFITGAGLENMAVDCTNGTAIYGLWMWSAFGCWVKDVKFTLVDNFVLFPKMALNCEFRGLWVNGIKNAFSNGSGIIIENSSACLVEDCIVYNAFPHFEVNYGTSGCVFAFNFCELNDVGGSIMGASIDSNHGSHNSFNLYEGNWGSMFQADGYFGSVSNDLVARNRFHGTNELGTGTSDDDNSQCISLKRMAWQYVVVGNVLGMTQAYWTAKSGQTIAYERTTDDYSYDLPAVYQLGYPYQGDNDYNGTATPSAGDFWASWPSHATPGDYAERDLDVALTLTRKGNYNFVDQAVPASESLGGDTIADSYFRSSKPSVFGILAWPPYDPLSPGSGGSTANLRTDAEKIPAGYRYYNGTNPPAAGSSSASLSGLVNISGNATVR